MDPSLTLAAAGDAILTRRLSRADDDRIEEIVSPLRDADVAIGNLEVLAHDYEGYPAAESGGTYMRAPPWIVDELRWAGFDALAAATNHVGDFSIGGMEATMEALEERDVPYAGLGRTLADARSPAYVDTPGGTIALVATCSTITPGTQAGRQRPDMHGRPGLSPLELETRFIVPEDEHDHLQELSDRLGLTAAMERRTDLGFPIPGEDEDGLTFYNPRSDHLQFVTGDEYRVERSPDEDDRAAVLEQLHAADRQADFVVASLHAHEGVGAGHNDATVPEWLEAFARDCVEAGADAFLGHGPHVLRGVEVYRDAPIFYSLGNFGMQNETITRQPAEIYERYDLDPAKALPADLFDARTRDEDGNPIGFLADRTFWESVVPVCEFGADGVRSVTLHPADLGFECQRPRRGTPRSAADETAERILDRLATLSEPYGTDIDVEDEVGVIDP